MQHRYTVFFVACALPLLFVGQIAPNMARELDFWLLWLLAMALVGLPVLFAEFALSARSGDTPWQGMQKLTREADASLVWRGFAVLSVLVALLISASISGRIAQGLAMSYSSMVQDVPVMGIAAGLTVMALILSLLRTRLLFVGVLLILAGSLWSVFDSSVSVPVMTDVSLGEWSRAVVLALLCVGVGTGLYWFGGMATTPSLMHTKKSLAGYILPIWFTQLIFGSLAILAGSALVNMPSFIATSLGMLLISAFLLYYVWTQLSARFGLLIAVVVVPVLALAFGLIPAKFLLILMICLSLVAVLLLAVFSGFVMKISHLRKTFNLSSELRYNLWRVLVRIVVPVAVLVAIIGLVLEWVA
ncbi:hypothetical protein [Moraxella marmotae]|uniref:hypothetical protein n=1 Tax=Moraxella marmotae TaxID=3344520 RepID=UPI0035F34749